MTCRAARQAGVQWSVLPRRVGWERGLSGLKTGPWLAEKELMRLGLRERLLPALVFGLTVAALPAAVVLVLGHITVRLTGHIHFYSVGFSALLAAAAAVGLTIVGR